MKKLILFVSAIIVAVSPLFSTTVTGYVFFDENSNGIKDQKEKGIKNVPVSNGLDIVTTDKKGFYKINAETGTSVFPVMPSAYTFSKKISNVKNAGFYYLNPKQDTPQHAEANFALTKTTVSENFRIGLIGDIQIDNLQELKYTNQTFATEIISRNDLSLNLILGDLVNEKPHLQADIKKMLEYTGHETWTIYGNHDRVMEQPYPQDMTYNTNFGASTYSFNHNNTHFLVFNNVLPKGKSGYIGNFTEKQLKFAANDLKLVSANSTVIVAMHIPLLYTENKDSLIDILSKFKNVIVVSGHMHGAGRIFHKIKNGNVIPEIVAGAVCGNWWTGEKDQYGNPSSIMQCGSPRNYFELSVQNKQTKIKFKGIGLDSNIQADIWMKGQDTIDNHVPALAELPENTILVNLFGASDSTKVVLTIDDNKKIIMDKNMIVAPSVARVAALGRADVYPTKYSKKAALRTTQSPHIWRTLLPADLNPGIHKVTIKANDNFGYNETIHTTFLKK